MRAISQDVPNVTQVLADQVLTVMFVGTVEDSIHLVGPINSLVIHRKCVWL